VRRPRRRNDKTNSTDTAPPTLSPPETSAADDADADVHVRPGRRTVEERQRAVLDLFAGKATIDQIARRLGVHADTVEGWRQDALGGVSEALRRGSGKTPAELELERKNQELEQVVTKLSIQKCLLENALETERAKRPTVPARSKR
jgi:transposase-like protein